MKNNFFITIIVSGNIYDFHRKIMILKLAEYVYPNKVIVINRPLDISRILKNKIISLKKFDHSLAENLIVLNSFILLHDRLSVNLNFFLNKLNFFFIRNNFNFLVKNLNLSNKKNILWTMHPNLNSYIDQIKYDYLIYDCYDEFLVKNALKNIEIREYNLVKISDLIITSSSYLKEKKQNLYNKKVFLHIPTAIDLDVLENIKKEKPNDLNNISYPIVGFAGALRDDFDDDLLFYIAKNRPNYSFVIVGAIYNNQKYKRLKPLKNIFFLGEKKYFEFLSYHYFFDVAISPHILNDFILSASPYKFFQYLSFNLNVVSSEIPEIVNFKNNFTKFKDKIFIAKTKEDFLCLLDKAIQTKDIKADDLSDLSWESRFKILFENINLDN